MTIQPDAEPTHWPNYRDTGCHERPSCLQCDLARCIFDKKPSPGGRPPGKPFGAWRRVKQDD